MKAIAKKGLMLLVIVSLLCGSVSTSVQASDQKSSKVTKVITLTSDMNTKKKYLTLYHHLEVDDNEEVIVNVKFLQVKGKVSLTSRDKELYSDWEKGLTWGGCLYKDGQLAFRQFDGTIQGGVLATVLLFEITNFQHAFFHKTADYCFCVIGGTIVDDQPLKVSECLRL